MAELGGYLLMFAFGFFLGLTVYSQDDRLP